MASFATPGSLRRSTFVCELCLSRLRPLRSSYLATSRLQRTTSFSTRIAATPRTERHVLQIPQCAVSKIPAKFGRTLPWRRHYATVNLPPQVASRALAHLPSRRLVSLSGPDTAKFLQGLITNNVDPNSRSPFYSAFLDSRGRVLWDVFVWTYPDLVAKQGSWACYIEIDGGEVESLVKHLRRHKLRSKVAIEVVGEEEMSVWAAWGVQVEQLQSEQLLAALPDPRGYSSPDFGTRCLLKGDQAPSNATVPVVDLEQYHIRRYLFGIPEGPAEIQRETALPMEVNIDLSHGIDFKKGCYVGQELTIRTKHTGVVRKRILPVQLYTSSAPPSSERPTFDPNWPTEFIPEPGADIKQLDEQGSIRKGRATGKIIATAGNVGLAMCRLEMMTSMRVSSEQRSWKPGAEFGIQGSEGVVKVQAVVPQGFRERERDLWDKNRTRI